jgi:hypothetical protein
MKLNKVSMERNCGLQHTVTNIKVKMHQKLKTNFLFFYLCIYRRFNDILRVR